MKAPFGALFPAIALVAAAVAIAAETDYRVSVPAAVGAVAAAALTLWDAAHRSPAARAPSPRRPGPGIVGARAWMGRGTLGRTQILLLVDRIDRGTNHPDLPIRPDAEMDRLVRLPDEEFRAYVHARLDAIEGTP
ncbi:MAG: hypothetical protein ACLQD8_06895 [Thermoplasmata archaeon]